MNGLGLKIKERGDGKTFKAKNKYIKRNSPPSNDHTRLPSDKILSNKQFAMRNPLKMDINSTLSNKSMKGRQWGSVLTPIRYKEQKRVNHWKESKKPKNNGISNHKAFPIKQKDLLDNKFNTNTLIKGRLRNFRVSHVNSINLYKETESPTKNERPGTAHRYVRKAQLDTSYSQKSLNLFNNGIKSAETRSVKRQPSPIRGRSKSFSKRVSIGSNYQRNRQKEPQTKDPQMLKDLNEYQLIAETYEREKQAYFDAKGKYPNDTIESTNLYAEGPKKPKKQIYNPYDLKMIIQSSLTKLGGKILEFNSFRCRCDLIRLDQSSKLNRV